MEANWTYVACVSHHCYYHTLWSHM